MENSELMSKVTQRIRSEGVLDEAINTPLFNGLFNLLNDKTFPDYLKYDMEQILITSIVGAGTHLWVGELLKFMAREDISEHFLTLAIGSITSNISDVPINSFKLLKERVLSSNEKFDSNHNPNYDPNSNQTSDYNPNYNSKYIRGLNLAHEKKWIYRIIKILDRRNINPETKARIKANFVNQLHFIVDEKHGYTNEDVQFIERLRLNSCRWNE